MTDALRKGAVAGSGRVPDRPPRPSHGPVIQTNIEEEIRRLSDRLEEATDELQKAAVDAASADVAYKREYHKAILRAQGRTQAERDASAFLVTADEYAVRKMEEALHASQVEACRSLRAQLSALQTLSANVRGQT